MKVIFVTDFLTKDNPGGAQVSNAEIIRALKSRGHTVHVVTYNSNHKYVNYKKNSVLISSNLEAITHHANYLLRDIMEHPCHVRIEHDLNRYWLNFFRKDFWATTKAAFFLSRLHLEYFDKNYGINRQNLNKVHIVPDPISRDFYNMNIKRKDICAYVGYFHPYKGAGKFLEYARKHPDQQFAIIGWADPNLIKTIDYTILPSNCSFVGRISHRKMPEIFNKIKYVFCDPYFPEPFCRAVGEALLCGCTIVSDNPNPPVGALEWYNELGLDGMAEACYNAAQRIVDLVEQTYEEYVLGRVA